MQNVMQLSSARKLALQIDTRRYAQCVEVSKRIRWDIDRDVIRGRTFDFFRKFLPDGLSARIVNALTPLSEAVAA